MSPDYFSSGFEARLQFVKASLVLVVSWVSEERTLRKAQPFKAYLSFLKYLNKTCCLFCALNNNNTLPLRDERKNKIVVAYEPLELDNRHKSDE